MNYINLYRKYRPQNFADLAGQTNLTTILKNAIFLNKFNHAYLFFGSHGTGKTTLARIFGKKVNCQNIKNNQFCNKCLFCLNDKNALLDIIEIDGASNNGIEEIRNLIKQITFTPYVGKFKVYIIDEVHMLTTQAFNALLKTLEEPPKHVIFILATTEIQKVPYTIISRCQTLEFKLLTINDIVLNLKKISKQEQIKITNDALILIAEFANGSMRDAFNLLEKLFLFNMTKKITEKEVLSLTRFVEKTQIYSLINNIFLKKEKLVFQQMQEFQNQQKDFYYLTLKILSLIKDFLKSDSVLIKELKISVSFAEFFLQTLIKNLQYVFSSSQKHLFFEIIILQMLKYEEQNKDISLTKTNNKQMSLLQKKILQIFTLLLQKRKSKDHKMTKIFQQLKNILFHGKKQEAEEINIFVQKFEKQNNIQENFSFLDVFLNNQIKMISNNAMIIVLKDNQKIIGKNLLEKNNKQEIIDFFRQSQFNIDDFIVLLEKEWLSISADYLSFYKKKETDIKKLTFNLQQLTLYQEQEKIIDPILKKAYELFGKEIVSEENLNE